MNFFIEETSKSTKNLNTISVCPAINASLPIKASSSEKDDFKNSVFQGVDAEQNGGKRIIIFVIILVIYYFVMFTNTFN